MTSTTTQIHGTVEPGFEPLRAKLEEQFAAGVHIGAGVCAYHHGRKVADIWGGLANDITGAPWEERTMALSFSTTKGLVATCLHVLADRGLVDYDAPVAKYWPEFAQNGKEKITVYHLLTHQSGMAPMPDGMYGPDLYDWERVIHAIEKLEPAWEPGTKSGYHALSFGFLVGEIVRRVSGKSIGRFLRDEICEPLGLRDTYIGTPPEVEPRIAKLRNRMIISEEMIKQAQERLAAGEPLMSPLAQRALGIRPDQATGERRTTDPDIDTPEGHASEVPAISGVMTARDLARLYACLAMGGELDGARIMSAERVGIMSKLQTRRPDEVVRVEVGWSLGYMNGGIEGWPHGMRDTAFGHPGFGGSIGLADPEIEFAFGFTTNALAMDIFGYGRTSMLAESARNCAEAIG